MPKVKMFLVNDWPEDGYANPGAVVKNNCNDISFCFACPGCGALGTIRLKPEPSPSWKIVSGSIQDCNLTLHPSINCVGCCRWHGWLRNGIFET